MGGSNSGAQFRMQSQSNGSGGSHWGGRGAANFQGGSNVQVQQSWQGGGDNHRSRWSGNNGQSWSGGGGGNVMSKPWSGNGGGWNNNNNDGGSSRHYRQDQGGVWRDQGNNDQWRKRGGNWNNNGGHNWNGNRNWNNGGNWNGHRRDDWRSWRNSNRDLFRLRPYHGPRGYSYQRFYRGYTLDSFFYDQQYWIDDPWQYRLPPAYGPYRWVRYYNDALLVNIYTGEIEDVITDFFW
jgi:hypothetical protein